MFRYLYPQGKRKALTFSYDDGCDSDRRLVEIFNKNGMKGTFHLNSCFLQNPGHVTPEELPTLYKGHEISCHSWDHPFLERVPKMTVVREMLEDKKFLEEHGKTIVRGLSYPMGTYSTELVNTLRELGFVYSRTVKSTGSFELPDDFLVWHPTCHHVDPKLMEYAKAFDEYRFDLPLFYVWGHSYEFNLSKNWNIIEDFCQVMSNKPEVWYATNIEIYNYIQALKQLDLSYDERYAFNRSAFELFIGRGSSVYKLAPGVMVDLENTKPWKTLS